MKTLQLKDIACYLPYSLLMYHGEDWKVGSTHWIISLIQQGYKPALRPMSDLTKLFPDGTIPLIEIAKMYGEDVPEDCKIEQRTNFLFTISWTDNDGFYHRFSTVFNGASISLFNTAVDFPLEIDVLDYLHEHMFDYRGLIHRGLAVYLNSVKEK